jgi:hypothetical protein
MKHLSEYFPNAVPPSRLQAGAPDAPRLAHFFEQNRASTTPFLCKPEDFSFPDRITAGNLLAILRRTRKITKL